MFDKPIIFITNREHNIKNSQISVTSSTEQFQKEFKASGSVAFDREFNGLNTHYAIPLLSQYKFNNSENIYVIDDTSINPSPFLEANKHKLFIGHNIEIDYRLTKWHNKVALRNLWDTMLVERELRKGMGHKNDLKSVLNRRLGLDISKEERERFQYLTKSSTFIEEDIIYAAGDVVRMHDLVEIQQDLLDRFDLNFFLKEIKFKMIPILSDCSLEGIELIDTPKHWRYSNYSWIENIQDFEKQSEEIKLKLDKILSNLPKERYEKIHLLKKYFVKPRKVEKSYQTDLFGDATIQHIKNIRNINYNSTTQLKTVFLALDLHVPTIKKRDEKLGKKVIKESTGEEALELYKIDNPYLDKRIVKFIDTLIELKGIEKSLSSFGERFLHSDFKVKNKKAKLGYRNSITGKIHTIYSQSTTATSRLSSGKEANGYYNSQQVPKLERFRHCFTTDKGYNITTADLSGAELVIAASLSGDPRLIELVLSEDQHSPLAEVGFNAIISIIMSLPTNDNRKREELRDLLEPKYDLLSKEQRDKYTKNQIWEQRIDEAFSKRKLKIVKETSNDIRDKYKAVNYGLAYGAGADRIAEILNIPKVYAEAVEKAMRLELPLLFKYLDDNADKGTTQGYIEFNSRTHSRHYFKQILDNGRKDGVPFGILKDVERACKNYPIQGTQGDMIMEATVRFFFEYVYPNGYDIQLLLHVHDEMAIKHKENEPEHAEVLAKYMSETANLYLAKAIKMKCKPITLETWTK